MTENICNISFYFILNITSRNRIRL